MVRLLFITCFMTQLDYVADGGFVFRIFSWTFCIRAFILSMHHLQLVKWKMKNGEQHG